MNETRRDHPLSMDSLEVVGRLLIRSQSCRVWSHIRLRDTSDLIVPVLQIVSPIIVHLYYLYLFFFFFIKLAVITLDHITPFLPRNANEGIRSLEVEYKGRSLNRSILTRPNLAYGGGNQVSSLSSSSASASSSFCLR